MRMCHYCSSCSTLTYCLLCDDQGDDLERRRSKLKSWFRVLDARDYKDIATVELERPIFDLSINEQSSLLSVVEGRQLLTSHYEEEDSICRVYDIGRKRPSEDDSDVEDDQDGSDLLEDDEFDEESDGEEDDDDPDDDDDDDDMDEDDYDDEDSFADDESAADESESESGGDSDGSVPIMALAESDADVEDADEDSEAQYESSLERSGLAGRDIRFLFEIPDVTYYDMHGQYSSDEEDEAEDDD
jgi:hypothetical protein